MCFITKKKHDAAIAKLDADMQAVIRATLNEYKTYIKDYIAESIAIHKVDYHIAVVAPPQDWFDPKFEPYPDELYGMKLGFAIVKEECCLWHLVGNVLYPYQDDSWGSNTNAKRVMVNPTRKAVAVNRKGTDYHFDEPRPFEFNDGIRAYEVCPLQTIDGKDLFAGLYLLVRDVDKAWIL